MTIRINSAPCHGCPERHELCHADCHKYAQYRMAHERNYAESSVIPARSDHERKPSRYWPIAQKRVAR